MTSKRKCQILETYTPEQFTKALIKNLIFDKKKAEHLIQDVGKKLFSEWYLKMSETLLSTMVDKIGDQLKTFYDVNLNLLDEENFTKMIAAYALQQMGGEMTPHLQELNTVVEQIVPTLNQEQVISQDGRVGDDTKRTRAIGDTE